jgi:hypothetical protein
MFEAVKLLMERTQHQDLDVFHAGYVWRATFQWNQPTHVRDMHHLFSDQYVTLPQDYIVFLSEISDGAILFYDNQFGQWGFKIFSTAELLTKQSQWHKYINNDDELDLSFLESCSENQMH